MSVFPLLSRHVRRVMTDLLASGLIHKAETQEGYAQLACRYIQSNCWELHRPPGAPDHKGQPVLATHDQGSAPGIALDIIAGTTGHAVVAEGLDGSGTPAMAVWHLTCTGQPTAAWVVTTTMLAEDATTASQVLAQASRRALVAWDAGGSAALLLNRLAEWSGMDPVSDRPEVLLVDALAEISHWRATYAAAVDDYRSEAKSKIEPLAWRHEVPSAHSWEEFVAETRVRPPNAVSTLASQVLHLARATAWVAELWQDTETARMRRRYLVERFGPATPLPLGWLRQLRAAHGSS